MCSFACLAHPHTHPQELWRWSNLASGSNRTRDRPEQNGAQEPNKGEDEEGEEDSQARCISARTEMWPHFLNSK
jgi:hypothetical protein